MPTLIGPFHQLLPMTGLPEKGPLQDAQLPVLEQAGLVVYGGQVTEVDSFAALEKKAEKEGWSIQRFGMPLVVLPGFIDCHTHICFSGSRATDYALRNQGVSYMEIARQGGGIWSTVLQTREASLEKLAEGIRLRADLLFQQGITTVEVKSGYGLSVAEELKMLEAIQMANARTLPNLVPTCLGAHLLPGDFKGEAADYLQILQKELLPEVRERNLARRVDIFIEETAFSPEEALPFLQAARQMGFQVTVHADQFSVGGSRVAVETEARSADHLEASGEKEIQNLANSSTVAVALPGASLGLGMPFCPARKLLDAGASLAIASDWNPGSAPMGHLLTQASILGAYEKLSNAEVLAGITFRAAKALGLRDRGRIAEGCRADLVAFPASDYREITWRQGQLTPAKIWMLGEMLMR